MKSFPKVGQNPALQAWNPPDLEAEAIAKAENIQKEQVLAVFQNDEDERKSTTVNSALHHKDTGKRFSSWQPNSFGHETKAAKNEEWCFIEVSDTPFDRSWKPQAPNLRLEDKNQEESFIVNNEIPMILERTRLQAEEIILAAQAEADEVILQAQSEIDERKKEAYQQGRDEARAEIEDTLKAARKIVEELETWKTEFISGSEPILVDMLKDISRKMFGEGARLDPQALHVNLNRIMENARGLGVLKIFLNPNDAKLLDPSWGEQQMLVLGEQVKIVASGNILPGGCLIKGNIGTIDGRVETQLDSILKTFDETEPTAG